MARAVLRGVLWAGTIGFAGIALAALSIQAQPRASASGTIPAQNSLAGVPMGGRTQEDAAEAAGEIAARLKAYPLLVRHGRTTERTTPGALGAAIDLDGVLEQLSSPPPVPDNLIDRIRTRFSGPGAREVALPVRLTGESVLRGLMRFALRIGAEPRNARLTWVRDRRTVVPPRAGRELDSEALAQALQAALNQPEFQARLARSLDEETVRAAWLRAQPPLEVAAATRAAEARVTVEHLRGITAPLTNFSTGMGGSSRNRVHNVSLACRAVDGTVLLPGDVFSYNDIVGPRLPATGYRKAPVIVRGELIDGIAGGICQVSSTLYNAALLADLEIVRRRHHAFPVPYVPAGRDATVVDGLIDLRFRNTLPHPVALDARLAGGRVTIRIWGNPADRRQVSLVSSGQSRLPASIRTVSDPRLPKGKRVVEKKARAGQRVTLTRVVKQGGAVVRREVISRDYYPPFAGIVRVGTREMPAQEKPAPSAKALQGKGPAPGSPAGDSPPAAVPDPGCMPFPAWP